jgi:diguanylate cyclase (GGDEF)-like protein
VLFLGACTVLALNMMSLQTAHDVRRLAVLELENITDPLTGMHNRRYLEKRLREEIARARRHGLPMSILLMDIDHFKIVNDTHGHPFGDLVLVELAKVIQDTVRNPDIVARYGGEEILVIAPDTPMAAALRLAERLRASVEAATLPSPGKATGASAPRVTVSIGVVSLDADADSSALFRRADAELYRAKREGRNRVVAEGPPPA